MTFFLTKIFGRNSKYVILAAFLLLLAGCGSVAEEEIAQEHPKLISYVHALPDEYFAHYFPVGANAQSREAAIDVHDEDARYIEFATKETANGIVHWAIKEFVSADGSAVLLVSDLLEGENDQGVTTTDQHFYMMRQDEMGEWNDETPELIEPAMETVRTLKFAAAVREQYGDETALKRGRFVFGAESSEVTTGVGYLWDVEFPLYSMEWNGSAFEFKQSFIEVAE